MARQIVYRGKKFDVAVEEIVSPDGRTARRETVVHPGAVAILPLIDADHVCLLRNVRHSVNEELWEIPAGTLEPNEPPDAAAMRELEEETGYRAASLRPLRSFYPSPGVLSEIMYLYVAEGLTPGPQRLEAGEQIVAHVVPWRDAVAWALDGTIRDAKTLVAVLLWERLRLAGRP